MACLGLLGGARIQGSILFQGQDLLQLDRYGWEQIRGGRIGMVFQDPASALNPVFSIGDQLQAVLARHRKLSGAALRKAAEEWMERVGLRPDRLDSYPHQLSGGMRQRVAIALALCPQPSLIFADEPTTALDVTVQMQVLDLLRTLVNETGTAVVLVSHDLGVVADLCLRVAVMYAGRVVEEAPIQAIFETPLHPYTLGLFAARPASSGGSRFLKAIPGSVPSPKNFPQGCAFNPRCDRAQYRCRGEIPQLEPASAPHRAACFFPGATPP
jgi:peptide/nickel transport system ATP-binding protein